MIGSITHVSSQVVLAATSDIPKGERHRGHGPSLRALREAHQASEYVSKHWLKHLLRGKIDIKVSFMCPWLPNGPLQSSEGPQFPGLLVARGPGCIGPLVA